MQEKYALLCVKISILPKGCVPRQKQKNDAPHGAAKY